MSYPPGIPALAKAALDAELAQARARRVVAETTAILEAAKRRCAEASSVYNTATSELSIALAEAVANE